MTSSHLTPSPDPWRAPYGRTLIQSGPSLEVLRMTWRTGGRCAPHDHGAAEGTITLQAGRFVERRYRFEAGALSLVSESEHRAGEVLTATAGLIHDMESLVPGGVTIHTYAPRIEGMRVYDVARRLILVVRDDCGAWIPRHPDAIVARLPWDPPEALPCAG